MSGPNPLDFTSDELPLIYQTGDDGHAVAASEWERICAVLKANIGASNFERFFAPITVVSLDGTRLILRVPNVMHEYWIADHYQTILNGAIAEVMDGARAVEFLAESEEIPPPPSKKEKEKEKTVAHRDVRLPLPTVAQQEDHKLHRNLMECGLNSQFSFGSFVAGPNCNYSYTVAKVVADKPGKLYNPLFLHGDVGLGKTHLMQAIGQEIVRNKPRKTVRYVTSESFTNEYIEALRKTGVSAFRAKYRKVDVLLVDDVQFFAGKDSTQEEFFHTFNDLWNSNKQIVVTSDRAPSAIRNIENRLASRFESGLTTRIEMPDLETRIAILRQKMMDWTVAIDDWVLSYLADRISSNVRRLEGALMQVAAHMSIGAGPITEDSLGHILKDVIQDLASAALTIDRIQKVVAEHFDVRMVDMTSHRRPKNIVLARQIAMFLARKHTQSSLKEIGSAFGGKDHGTVIHACRAVEEKLEKTEELRRTVANISDKLKRSNQA